MMLTAYEGNIWMYMHFHVATSLMIHIMNILEVYIQCMPLINKHDDDFHFIIITLLFTVTREKPLIVVNKRIVYTAVEKTSIR